MVEEIENTIMYQHISANATDSFTHQGISDFTKDFTLHENLLDTIRNDGMFQDLPSVVPDSVLVKMV